MGKFLMGVSRHLSLLALGLTTSLIAPVCANEGMMGMEQIPMASMQVTEVTPIGTSVELIALETVGMDTGSTGSSGLDSRTGSSDPWARIKLDKNPETTGFHFGPGGLFPDISVAPGYIDNLTFENANATGSFYTTVKPHLAYVMSDKTRKLVLDYLLDAGYFESSSPDNYVDNKLRASFDYNPTSRIFASAIAEFMSSHDGRGKGRAEAGAGITQTSLDEWHQWGLGGKFAYGARTARAHLEFEADYLNKTYDTNRVFTFTRDREDYFGAARFFYRIRPKTSLVFEGRATEINYINDEVGVPSLDGINTSFLTGLTWQATYKTTGFAKIGYNFRTFDSDQRATQSGLDWEVGVDWKPRSYSTVHLETSQSIAETNGTGDAINQSNISINWQHYWRERFSTRVDLGYLTSTFDPSSREDTSYLMGIRADYAFRRWLNIGTSFRHSTIDSTDAVFGSDQNIVELNLDLIF